MLSIHLWNQQQVQSCKLPQYHCKDRFHALCLCRNSKLPQQYIRIPPMHKPIVIMNQIAENREVKYYAPIFTLFIKIQLFKLTKHNILIIVGFFLSYINLEAVSPRSGMIALALTTIWPGQCETNFLILTSQEKAQTSIVFYNPCVKYLPVKVSQNVLKCIMINDQPSNVENSNVSKPPIRKDRVVKVKWSLLILVVETYELDWLGMSRRKFTKRKKVGGSSKLTKGLYILCTYFKSAAALALVLLVCD